MPQELALFLEFSIEETLIYFARIYGMTRAKFKERLIFLMDFLDLPSRHSIYNLGVSPNLSSRWREVYSFWGI